MLDLVQRLQESLARQYTIDREIGSGGMSHVLLAEDRKHRRKVAIKVLRPDIGSAVGPERFLREIEIAAQLSHPHILPLHDSGNADGLLYYVMPFVDGESLRDRLRRTGTVPVPEALRVARDVASALAYAHKRNIVHRDIKPENILLADGHAIVADFGIARAISEAGGDQLTNTGIAIGTLHYMSPEQALGDAVDGRTDIYALGTVVHEMLVGRTPHEGASARAFMSKLISEPAAPLETTHPEIPVDVARIVDRSLAKEPAQRYATAAEFGDALAGVAITEPTTTRQRLTPRRRIPIGAGAALGVLALGWLAWSQSGIVGVASGSSPNRIAVLPFSVNGGPQAAYLGEGIVDLLSRNLEGVEDVSSIDPATIMSTIGRGATTSAIDVPAARAFGRRVGAGALVLGSVTSVGPALRLQAAMYPAEENGGEPISRASVEGDTTRLLELVDRLAGQLLVNRRRDPANRLNQTAALTTHSLDALKAFLNAEHQLRGRAMDSAIAGYQRAIALDSTFALAYYRLAVAAGWSERHAVSSGAVATGLRHAERLSERDRRLIRAYADYRRGAADAAEQQYRAILDNYPDDLEAEFQLGDLLYQYNPLRGRPRLEARPLLDKVLANDPGFL